MTLLRGFDLSAYQSATAPSGADFIIVKATEGSGYTSSRFAAQWTSAKSKAKHRGAYHFARPEDSSAASQAARFLSVVKPAPGESVWLDLEASDLNQGQTNAWAKAWGDYIRDHTPGVTSGVYMGRGYATNGTGRDLADHFTYWWMPQYPSTTKTSTWRTTFTPAVPSGLTCGWTGPHLWQWTDNFNGLDASISPLTLEQLAAGASIPTPQPLEDDMAVVSSLGVDGKQVIAAGTTADVKFTKEYTDKHGLHSQDGLSVVIAPAAYWVNASALVELHGLTPGARLDVAWTRVKDDGAFIDDAWRKPLVADENGVIRDELGGQFGVDATNRLRLRVYNASGTDVTVQSCMAKASLLKF
jgi:hypothetical protein